jgi:hypothetical protein
MLNICISMFRNYSVQSFRENNIIMDFFSPDGVCNRYNDFVPSCYITPSFMELTMQEISPQNMFFTNTQKDIDGALNSYGATDRSSNPKTIKQQIKEHWNNFCPKLPEISKDLHSPCSMRAVYQAKRIVM